MSSNWIELPMPVQESGLPDAAADNSQPAHRTARTVLYLLRNCATFQFHDTSAKASLNMRWDESETARMRSDGGNLAPILLHRRPKALQPSVQLLYSRSAAELRLGVLCDDESTISACRKLTA